MHLLACLLSNVEHPDGDCNQEICSQVQQKDSRQYRSYASMAAVPLAFFTPMEERSYSVNRFAYCTFRLSSSYFSSLFDRGPPCADSLNIPFVQAVLAHFSLVYQCI